jgi:hypothetical protein
MKPLRDAEIDAYQRDGYVIPGFRLSDARVAALQTALDELIAANPQVPPESLVSAHVVNSKAEQVRGHPAFFDLAMDPQILDMVEQVIGPDIIARLRPAPSGWRSTMSRPRTAACG